MGWELRRTSLNLYRNEWVDGRRVKVYLAKAGTPAGVLLEHGLTIWHERRAAERRASADLRTRVSNLLATVAAADAELRLAAEGVLAAVGFHRHKRGELRMKRTANTANTAKATATKADAPMVPYHGTPSSAPKPLIHYIPLNNLIDNADDLFACARAGDEEAQDFLRRELSENDRARRHYGDLGRRATKMIIARVTGGDPPWCIAVEEQVHVMMQELLGPTPTILDRLIVRRIVNAWVAVYGLELELAISPPGRPRDRAYLEAAAERASRKMSQAVTELARVRKLQLPNVLVNITPPTPPPPPPPRVAQAEVVETEGPRESVEGVSAAGRRLPTTPKTKKARREKGVKGSGRQAA